VGAPTRTFPGLKSEIRGSQGSYLDSGIMRSRCKLHNVPAGVCMVLVPVLIGVEVIALRSSTKLTDREVVAKV